LYFFVGHGIEYRVGLASRNAREIDLASALFYVPIELDRQEKWIVKVVNDDAENIENRSFRLTLAREYFKKCVTLLFACIFRDYRLHMAVAVVYGSREEVGGTKPNAIEANIAEMALIHLKCHQAVAVALRRWRHRLARAAVIATTVFGVLSFYVPFCICHTRLPYSSR
jgi:predicted restriction endonuclease